MQIVSPELLTIFGFLPCVLTHISDHYHAGFASSVRSQFEQNNIIFNKNDK
jgi:hypothetical protein